MRKSLSLRRETLSELTSDELGGVVGASGSVCISTGGNSCSVCGPTVTLPPLTIQIPEIRLDD